MSGWWGLAAALVPLYAAVAIEFFRRRKTRAETALTEKQADVAEADKEKRKAETAEVLTGVAEQLVTGLRARLEEVESYRQADRIDCDRQLAALGREIGELRARLETATSAALEKGRLEATIEQLRHQLARYQWEKPDAEGGSAPAVS